MKKALLVGVLAVGWLWLPSAALAQGMMGNSVVDDHTALEEAEGKEVWEKLQAKQLDCKDVSEEGFEALGEYFMGQMMGDAHAAMNTMIVQMMGEALEEQMHGVMGKRLSGCDSQAEFPLQGRGFVPMMGMMGAFGGGLPTRWGGFGGGSIVNLVLGVWLVVGVLAAIWLLKQIGKKN